MWRNFLAWWLAGLMPLAAAGPANRPMDVSRSESGQYLAVSRDRTLNRNLLELASKLRRRLSEELGLPRQWRHLVRLVPYEAQNERLVQYPLLKAFLDDGQLSFEIHFPTNTPQALEEFVRTLIYTYLYEAVLIEREDFSGGQTLPTIPMWLAEGVLQQLDADRAVKWRQIVQRAVTANKAPPLREVIAWNELSSDTLMRAWQQAFTFQLVDHLTDSQRSGEFIAWLRREADNPKQPFASLRPMMDGEIDWRQALSLAGEKSQKLVFDFEETASRFASMQTVRVPLDPEEEEADADEEKEPQSDEADGEEKEEVETEYAVAKLNGLAPYHGQKGLASVLSAKNEELLDLEIRAHFAWKSVLAWYRAALARLKMEDGSAVEDYEMAIRKAEAKQRELQIYNERLEDYYNWFRVAKTANAEETAFEDYYRIREEIEAFAPSEIDPLRSRQILIQSRQ
ncbi:MAG: hypothetical protein AAGK14_11240 [Verrucomicrobiota bacterium]